MKMDYKKLFSNDSFLQEMIARIAAEVMKKIPEADIVPAKRALVCFCGGSMGFSESMDSLKKLVADGWQLKVYMSTAATKVLTPDYIKTELKLDTIYDETSGIPWKDLYVEADQIIIAQSTINTVAKLASGICDTGVTTLLNQSLMAGKPMVCAIDGASPDNPTRAQIGMGNASPGYRMMLNKNLKTIKSFGIELANAKDLYTVCKGQKVVEPMTSECEVVEETEIVETAVKAAQIEKKVAPKAAINQGAITLTKTIISRKDIYTNKNTSKIIVPANAIITDYAQEAAKELKIQLVKA